MARDGGSTKRPDIQGLRALAVTLVVLFHAGLPVPGGFTGVDVFFVVSGFVITGMLLPQLRADGSLRFADFYRRRVRRLLPALAVVLLAVAAAAAVLQSPLGPQGTTAKTGIAAALFAANAEVYRSIGGYFAAPAEANPLLHTWTLAVEEQFYLVFPLFILVAWRFGASRRRSSSTLVAALVLIAVVSFLLSLVLTVRAPVFAFYGSPDRAWEFAAGALLASVGLSARPGARGRSVAFGLSIAGVALVLLAAFGLSAQTAFPGYAALLPVTGAACLLAAGALGRPAVTRWLSTPAMNWVGDRSYSIYLWHWPFVVFARLLWPASTLATATAAAISIAPAALSFTYVEQPIRQRRLAVPAVGVALVCIALPIAAFLALGGLSRHRAAVYYAANATDAASLTCDATRTALPAGTKVWVVGDSHAGALLPSLTCAANSGVVVVDRHLDGCPFSYVSVRFSNTEIRRGFPTTPQCIQYVSTVVRDLGRQHPDVVLIANRSPRYVNPEGHDEGDQVAIARWRSRPGRIAAPDDNARTWTAGIRRAVTEIRRRGAAVVMFETVPDHTHWEGDCLGVVKRAGCGPTPATDVLGRRIRAVRAETAIARTTAGAVAVDGYSKFCSAKTCTQYLGHTLAYKDNDHLNAVGAWEVAPLVIAGSRAALKEERVARRRAIKTDRP